DGGVDPLPTVVAFNVGEQVAPRGIAIGVFALVDKFGFQGAEEALHRRVIPAVCLAAHRWGDGGGLQDLAVIAGGVLTAAIRMMDRSSCSISERCECSRSERAPHESTDPTRRERAHPRIFR